MIAMNIICVMCRPLEMNYVSVPNFSEYQTPSGPKVVVILRFYCTRLVS